MATLKVAETFLSLQGESTYAGLLCFFIRCSGCNLSCAYCDTKYAAATTSGHDEPISDLVANAVASGATLVEITGGEPLLQPETVQLCRELQASGMKVLIETNGSMPIADLPPRVIRILDCKTPSSGESHRNLYSNYDFLTPEDEIKFVLSDIDDYSFANAVIEKYQLFDKTEKILFSPVPGKFTPHELAERMCADRSRARLQLQLHKQIWGVDAKGV